MCYDIGTNSIEHADNNDEEFDDELDHSSRSSATLYTQHQSTISTKKRKKNGSGTRKTKQQKTNIVYSEYCSLEITESCHYCTYR